MKTATQTRSLDFLLCRIWPLNRYYCTAKQILRFGLTCLQSTIYIVNESICIDTVMMYVYGGCGFESCPEQLQVLSALMA